ncbi:MAG: hypothetical protein ABIA21_03765 [Candidatus Aenigmatarchaeota archaeon]
MIIKLHVAKTPIGVFAFSLTGEMVSYKLFDKRPENAVKGFLDDIPEEIAGGHDMTEDSVAQQIARKKIRELAIHLGFFKSDEEFNIFIAEFCFHLSKKNLRGSIGRDKFVIQASNALDDIMKMQNLASMRIIEWFGLHYPEMRLAQSDIDKIVEFGNRENWPGFKDSTGVELNAMDERIIKEYALTTKNLLDQRRSLEKYVKESMFQIAPNFTSLIDPTLAAKILALAGSLEKLSKMSASSIQLIGAEKALFRHLRSKGKSPKYGIIFLSGLIQSVSESQRGKVARILAAKLMQAARIDYFSGRDESDRIKKELNSEIKGVVE